MTTNESLIEGGLVLLTTSDFEATHRFYTDTLGFSTTYRAGNDCAEIRCGNLVIGLHGPHGSGDSGSQGERMSIQLRVGDLERAIEKLGRRGVDFGPGIREDAAVRLVRFRDPDGAPLYLYQQKRV